MTPQEAIDALGLTMTAVFVPFSQSRNAKEKNKSLNWKVTIHRNGRDILTTDYAQGVGHVPGYKYTRRDFVYNAQRQDEIIREATEKGRRCLNADSKSNFLRYDSKLPPPTIADVMYSLISDANVLDAGTFEQWAPDFGYDPDSRTGERIYQQCIQIAVALRASVGDKGLRQLQTAFEDY